MTHKEHPDVQELFGGREPLILALKSGVILQVFLFVLTALILDGGQIMRQFLVAMIGYWLGVALIALRRERAPTATDLLFIRYGSLVLLLLAPFVATLVYWFIGESTLNGLQRWF